MQRQTGQGSRHLEAGAYLEQCHELLHSARHSNQRCINSIPAHKADRLLPQGLQQASHTLLIWPTSCDGGRGKALLHNLLHSCD